MPPCEHAKPTQRQTDRSRHPGGLPPAVSRPFRCLSRIHPPIHWKSLPSAWVPPGCSSASSCNPASFPSHTSPLGPRASPRPPLHGRSATRAHRISPLLASHSFFTVVKKSCQNMAPPARIYPAIRNACSLIIECPEKRWHIADKSVITFSDFRKSRAKVHDFTLLF